MTRINWWPLGHQFPSDTESLRPEDRRQLQVVLERAEIEADNAQALLDLARLNDASPPLSQFCEHLCAASSFRPSMAFAADVAGRIYNDGDAALRTMLVRYVETGDVAQILTAAGLSEYAQRFLGRVEKISKQPMGDVKVKAMVEVLTDTFSIREVQSFRQALSAR